MLAGIAPDIVNAALKAGNGFADGALVKWDVAARLLGLPYDSQRTSPVLSPCIAETDHYKNKGVPQHFFVWLGNGRIIDPLDGKEKPDSTYRIVGYRNIGTKGEDVTNEQAKLLIYRATQGHEPAGDERSFALGPISPDDLADLRFRDDVVELGWRASTGGACPQSEKEYWQRAQKDHPNDHIANSLGNTWYNDHVKAPMDALNRELANVKTALSAAISNDTDASASLQSLQNELDSTKLDLLKAKSDLKDCQVAGTQNMSGLDMIIEGIRKVLRIS